MSEEKEDPQWGEKEYEGDGPNLRYDDFVGQIVQNPKEPPCVTLLSGYLGSSSEEGHVRLYLDEELCRYVEIPEKAIRHTQELSPEQSPLGGSLVWIDHDAEVLHGAAGSERRKATFLEGQIAQDYIGGAGGYDLAGAGITTQTRECKGGGGILPTDMGPGCGPSQFGPCIPPTELPGCRTLTGIFCTRFGPSCRRTLFEPACTLSGPNCRTVLLQQCQSVYNPCITQHQSYCQVTGGVPCYPPFDFTIYEQPGGQPQFAGGQDFGAAQNFAALPPTNFCPPTRTISCPSQLIVACFTRFPNECQLETAVRCVSRVIRCPTIAEPRCRISQIAFCPDTVAGCQFESAVCGFDPGGTVIQERIALPQTINLCPPQSINCPPQTINISCQSQFVAGCFTRFPNECQLETAIAAKCQSRFYRCPTVFELRCQPTRSGPRCLISQFVACGVSQFAPCQIDSAFCGVDPWDIGVDPAAGGAQAFGAEAYVKPTLSPHCPVKPTQSPHCPEHPTQSPHCPGVAGVAGGGALGAIPQTQFCPSRVIRCQSAVDLCPSRLCPSVYTPCVSQLVRCPSALDACPTRFNCPTLPNGCPGTTQFGRCETFGACPSAVDACPTRFGCFETQFCGGGESIACFPGGGFDPGGGGGFGGF